MPNDLNHSYQIPSSYSRLLARELALQERDLPDLLRGTGLSTDVLLPGDESRLSGRQQLQVLANAQRFDCASDFGLRLGRRLDPMAHGPIGYLALSSPDLGTALASLRDFLPVRIPFTQLKLLEGDEWLVCELNLLLTANGLEKRMLLECFVMLIQAMVESFLQRELTEALVCFEFPQPGPAAIYADYIHGRIKFGGGTSSIRIPAELLKAANNSGDTDSYAAAREMCTALLAKAPPAALSMSERVRRFLLAQPAGSVSEEDVARSLYVSKRTLARRLRAEHTGYRQIRDQVLAELAALQLREGKLGIDAMAALLGYHDAANFRRAFRRWYGCSPSAYRTRHCASRRP